MLVVSFKIMKTIAFVPARCGSKSIPLKNIQLFCGMPLIFWVLQSLDQSDMVDETYVATDCDEIKDIVESFGFKKNKIYIRDAENAQDESSTESVLLEFLSKSNFSEEDRIILVQATCPLVTAMDFNNALDQFFAEEADSLLSSARIKIFLWNADGTPLNYDYRKRPRRQEFKGEIMENGSFYITSVGALRNSGNRLSGKIAIYEMPPYTAVDIDDEDDWNRAEILMKKYLLTDSPKSD